MLRLQESCGRLCVAAASFGSLAKASLGLQHRFAGEDASETGSTCILSPIVFCGFMSCFDEIPYLIQSPAPLCEASLVILSVARDVLHTSHGQWLFQWNTLGPRVQVVPVNTLDTQNEHSSGLVLREATQTMPGRTLSQQMWRVPVYSL